MKLLRFIMILFFFQSFFLNAQSLYVEKIDCNSIMVTEALPHEKIQLSSKVFLLEREEIENIWYNVKRDKTLNHENLFFDLETGNYRVTTVTNSEAKQTSNTIFIKCDEIQKSVARIFPNPVRGELMIMAKIMQEQNFAYKIISLDGVLVFEGPLFSQETKVNTSGLVDGMYVLQIIEMGKVVEAKKLIITNGL